MLPSDVFKVLSSGICAKAQCWSERTNGNVEE